MLKEPQSGPLQYPVTLLYFYKSYLGFFCVKHPIVYQGRGSEKRRYSYILNVLLLLLRRRPSLLPITVKRVHTDAAVFSRGHIECLPRSV